MLSHPQCAFCSQSYQHNSFNAFVSCIINDCTQFSAVTEANAAKAMISTYIYRFNGEYLLLFKQCIMRITKQPGVCVLYVYGAYHCSYTLSSCIHLGLLLSSTMQTS